MANTDVSQVVDANSPLIILRFTVLHHFTYAGKQVQILMKIITYASKTIYIVNILR